MRATSWLIVAIVGFSLSGIALIASIIMFVKLNVPGIIGDLTGKTAAREVKARKDANASSSKSKQSSGAQQVSGVQIDRSAIAAAHASRRLDRASTTGHSSQLSSPKPGKKKVRSTESRSTNMVGADAEKRGATAILSQNSAGDSLEETQKTGILIQPDGADEICKAGQTELLSEPHIFSDSQDAEPDIGYETTVLSEPEEICQEKSKPVAFSVTRSVIKIHTDEVI